mmetsp:Transcript_79768/g.258386  ORF Transcript_79768/g.258386 Transcript_79768/m.258386 type:complete len:141 (+) Transcript_79768:68-490(+)
MERWALATAQATGGTSGRPVTPFHRAGCTGRAAANYWLQRQSGWLQNHGLSCGTPPRLLQTHMDQEPVFWHVQSPFTKPELLQTWGHEELGPPSCWWQSHPGWLQTIGGLCGTPAHVSQTHWAQVPWSSHAQSPLAMPAP